MPEKYPPLARLNDENISLFITKYYLPKMANYLNVIPFEELSLTGTISVKKSTTIF